MHGPLLWLDIETTGLSPESHLLLEVGMVLTDADLKVVSSLAFVLGWSDREVSSHITSPDVWEMHRENGLIEDVARSQLQICDAEHLLVSWVKSWEAMGLPMAGSGVHFDRKWLEMKMPTLVKQFHYRNFDVTTLRYFFGDEKAKCSHRALADLHQNIEELRKYRQTMEMLTGMRRTMKAIEVDPCRVGGVPVIAGTRFTVAQLLAELTEPDATVQSIALDYDLPREKLDEALEELAALFNRPGLPMRRFV